MPAAHPDSDATATIAERSPLGSVIADRFELRSIAGRGGMGVVYRAHDRASGADVALKMIALPGDEHLARFRREARVLSALRHPGIVRHIDDGRTAGGDLYLAMEWLEGEALSSKSLPCPADAIPIARRVAEALAVAHQNGVVHRDIKPANILLRGGRADDVVVLDFGLARLARADSMLTRSGVVLGTPAYMSPEQAGGRADVDARADVFSLACMLYEMLTGVCPFRAETFVATLARVLLEDPPPLRELMPEAPAELESLLIGMLAKAPDERPKDGGAVAAALRAFSSMGSSPTCERPATAMLGERERNVVSVLLARAPEEARAALRACVAELHGASATRHGELADATLAITFAGRHAFDQAERALRVADAMRAAIPDATIAIGTGMGELSTAGKHERSLGDVLDRTATLLSGHVGQGLVLDEVTTRLATARLGGEASASAIVGRTRELGILEALYEECSNEPIARAALVVAPAGMGKSRLFAELRTRLATRAAAPLVLVAASDAITAGSTYASLASAIRRAADIRQEDALDVARAKLHAHVTALGAAGEAARIAQFLGEIASISFDAASGSALAAARRDPSLRGDQVRRAALDWLELACARSPVVLVLEDVHWGDTATVQLVEAALRRLAAHAFMVLALARPEVRESFPGLFRDHGATEIALRPLLPSAAAALVRSRLGADAKPELVEEIVRCADGLPFLLDELSRGARDGRVHPAHAETAVAVAAGALENLEGDARRVLRAASIFGGPFRADAVAELCGGSTGVSAWLAELAERDVLRQGREPNLYIFRHDLLREAAYGALTPEDCRLAHALAGAFLESTGHDDAIALARHFDRGGVRERAAHWYRRAAEVALEGSDIAAVLGLSQRAIEAGASGEELGRIELLRAEAHMWRGENADAEAHALAGMQLLPSGSRAWFRAASEAAAAAGKLRHKEQLFSIAEQLLAADARLELDAARIAWARTALQFSNMMFFERADALLAHIETHGGASAATPLAAGYIYSSMAYRGTEISRVQLAELAVKSFEAAGHFRNACLESLSVGHGLLEIGGHRRWLPQLQAALATTERLGLTHANAVARMQLAGAYYGLGDLERAEVEGNTALAAFGQQGNTFMQSVTREYLSLIALARGDAQAAANHAELALATSAETWWLRASHEASLALAVLANGAREQALSLARSAMSSLDKGGDRTVFKGLVRLCLAEALLANGRIDEAKAAIVDARDRLLARAALFDEPARSDFLRVQPEHARTVALAESLGV